MALTEDRGIHARQTARLVPLRVAAGTTIHMGAIVAVNGDGWAVPAADTAGLQVIGVAQEAIDNTSGLDGARTVRVQKGVFGIENGATPIAQAHVGRSAYVEHDGAVGSAAGAHSIVAGVVDELGDDGLVYVYFA